MRLFCLFTLTRDSTDLERPDGGITITLGGRELATSPANIDFQTELRTTTIVSLQGLVIPGPGILRASLSLNDSTEVHWDMQCEGRSTQIRLPLQEDYADSQTTMSTNPQSPTHDR